MTDHPQWVWKRAAQELNRHCSGWIPEDRELPAMQTVANLIAKYEQPPVDPDEAVVKAVVEAWCGYKVDWWEWAADTARALAVYKAHKALDTTPTT